MTIDRGQASSHSQTDSGWAKVGVAYHNDSRAPPAPWREEAADARCLRALMADDYAVYHAAVAALDRRLDALRDRRAKLAKLQRALDLTGEHCERSPLDPQCALMRLSWAGRCSTAKLPWASWTMPWRSQQQPAGPGAACHGGRFALADAPPTLYEPVGT